MAHQGLTSAAQHIASYGRGNDTMLAHITPSEAQFMDSLQGGPRINPQTGLPEYGLFGKVLKGLARAAGAVVGFTLTGGNPLGAAAGAGLMTKATGGSWKSALTNAALAGVGGGAWNSFQGAPIMGGAAAGAGAGAGITSSALAAPAALSTPMVGAAGIGGTVGTAAAAAPAAAGLFGTGITGTQALIGGGLAATALGGRGGSDPGKPDWFEGPEGGQSRGPSLEDIKARVMAEGYTDRGFVGPRRFLPQTWKPGDPVEGYAAGGPVSGLGSWTQSAQNLPSMQQMAAMGRMMARKGGSIKGPGSGVEDKIPAMLSDGEHVWDASTTSLLGDGSNEEGHRRIERLKQMIRADAGMKNPKKVGGHQRGLGALLKQAKAA